MIAVSVISHRHGVLVETLVSELIGFAEVSRIIVTCNLPESLHLPGDPRIQRIDNRQSRGFGANHNAAFAICDSPYFCPINPDISFSGNPFPALLGAMRTTGAALSAPKVVDPVGRLEDSARRFPTLASLARKALLGGGNDYAEPMAGSLPFSPDWVAGMFMLFDSQAYARLSGFNETYHLYYEDVDICVRLWRQQMRLIVVPGVQVTHEARRDSRKNLRFMRWHAHSMIRYLVTQSTRLPAPDRVEQITRSPQQPT